MPMLRHSHIFFFSLAFSSSIIATFLGVCVCVCVCCRYKWTEANHYFAIGKNDFIAVGGGNNFALWLDSELVHGSSKPCETFGCPVLASNPEFIVQAMEVWAFG